MNLSVRIIGWLVLAITVLFTGCKESVLIEKFASTTAVVPYVDTLKVLGTKLVNLNNENVVLRGVSYGHHNWWGRFYNSGTVSWLKQDWEANIVRAAVGIEPTGGYLNKPQETLLSLYKVIDAAINNGIYVIVDWHAHDIHVDSAKVFFSTVSTKYKDYPNILYEIYNEPVNKTWDEVKAYAEEIIPIIRANCNNIIIVGTPHYSSMPNVVADSPIVGYQNLMYTMHFYAGTSKQELRTRGNYAINKGLPIFVTECGGMSSSGDGPLDLPEWNRWLRWLDKNDVSHLMWSIADKNETCSMILGSGSSNGGWDPVTHLRAWGQVVRSYLKNPVPEPSITIEKEFEEGTLGPTAALDNPKSLASGSNAVNISTSYVNLTVDVTKAGLYEIVVRHFNWVGPKQNYVQITPNILSKTLFEFKSNATYEDKSLGYFNLSVGTININCSAFWGYTMFDKVTLIEQ